jgi:hypothetical protein
MTKPIVGNHPNATITALAGAITVILIWIVGVAGLAVPAEVGSAFTTIVAAVILALGRRRPSVGAIDGTPAEPVTVSS